MRRYGLAGVIWMLSVGDGGAECSIWRIVVDGAMVPAAYEIQEAGPLRRVVQTFTPPQEPIGGVELFVSRYPRDEPLDLAIRVTHGEQELGFGLIPIPSGEPIPVRLIFPPVELSERVAIEAWAPQGRPGWNAAIQFYPVDHYSGGELSVAGRPVVGDATFRVLTPDSSRFGLVPGLDLSSVPGRFPSQRLSSSGSLVQEFIVPLDSLAGVEFLAGTGGVALGPPLAWELMRDGITIHRGTIEATFDNVPVRLCFPPVLEAKDATFALRLSLVGAGELRLWLCGRGIGTGPLTVCDRLVDGSLVLTSLHLNERTDSLRVALAADVPPSPEPGLLLAGSCVLTQSFLWPREPGDFDHIGLRLALGEGMVVGSLVYAVRDELSGGEVHRDTVEVGGRGRDDYVWFSLGTAPRGRRLSVSVSGDGAKAETAGRFWWMPADVYGEGEAIGCVARAGGDCVFRLAEGTSLTRWALEFPRLSTQLAPAISAPALTGLLYVRLALVGVLGLAVCVGRRVNEE
ncbi:hypothetical protein JXA88_01580 [Candidatus Fermentibacteria bacterium]|nr:hypothetical protein [Candidatus Fermentibacteria bacterium]